MNKSELKVDEDNSVILIFKTNPESILDKINRAERDIDRAKRLINICIEQKEGNGIYLLYMDKNNALFSKTILETIINYKDE